MTADPRLTKLVRAYTAEVEDFEDCYTDAEGNFSGRLLRSLIRFAAGVGGNAVFGTLLLQADKLILSAMLPLKQFAYYSLASVIANMISMLASPVSGAVFPRFSQLVGSHSPESQISALYHLACQSVSVLVVPLSLTVAFFSYQSLYVYTGSAEIASNTATILTVLIVAKMLHASMIVPYALQLAYGWVRLSLYVNMVSVLWLVPAVYLLSQIYGPVGAAAAWLLVSVGYLTIGIPLMHRRLLLGEQWSWMWRVLVAPVAVVCVFLELIQLLLDEALFGRWLSGILLVSISVGAVAVAVGSSPDVRKWVIGHLPGWRKA